MKTLSVKQVADILGVSPRAILKRLNNGQLKGTRRTNKYGVEEWWVYPNKEIRVSLEAAGRVDILSADVIPDADIIDVDDGELDASEDCAGAGQVHNDWSDNARASTAGVAEELWNNIISRFLGELKERDQVIGEMRAELSDKDRQLKLLPDLEKQAESERKSAELRTLEIEALNKQISALEEEKRLLEAKANEAAVLSSDLEQLKKTVEELRIPWWKKWFSPVEPG